MRITIAILVALALAGSVQRREPGDVQPGCGRQRV